MAGVQALVDGARRRRRRYVRPCRRLRGRWRVACVGRAAAEDDAGVRRTTIPLEAEALATFLFVARPLRSHSLHQASDRHQRDRPCSRAARGRPCWHLTHGNAKPPHGLAAAAPRPRLGPPPPPPPGRRRTRARRPSSGGARIAVRACVRGQSGRARVRHARCSTRAPFGCRDDRLTLRRRSRDTGVLE